MNLKKTLKTIKLHQEEISMFFGPLILIIAGLFVIGYVKNIKNYTPTQETSIPESRNPMHVVSKGETLWSIALRYYNDGFNWKKIANANNIINPTKIKVGTKLIIPMPTISAPTPTPKPQISSEAASTSRTGMEINNQTYTVVKGDNLWKISVQIYGNGYKWIQIANANHLHNPNLIHSGNVFIIPR